MNGYQQLISTSIRSTDPDMLALAEKLMRIESPTLDALTRPKFTALARTAARAAAEMADSGELPGFCSAFGLAVPKNA
jgi:hypothetical protein